MYFFYVCLLVQFFFYAKRNRTQKTYTISHVQTANENTLLCQEKHRCKTIDYRNIIHLYNTIYEEGDHDVI